MSNFIRALLAEWKRIFIAAVRDVAVASTACLVWFVIGWLVWLIAAALLLVARLVGVG